MADEAPGSGDRLDAGVDVVVVVAAGGALVAPSAGGGWVSEAEGAAGVAPSWTGRCAHACPASARPRRYTGSMGVAVCEVCCVSG